MGTLSSETYEKNAARNQPFSLKLKLKISPWIKRARMARLKLGSHRVYPASAQCSITNAFDAQGEHYKKHGWAYVDPMLNDAFHAELLQNWPKMKHFDPPRELGKSYNTGFAWNHKTKGFSYSDPYGQYPTLAAFREYLRSPDFCKRVKAFNGADQEMMLYSFIANEAGYGSEVIPHIDGNRFDPKAKHFLNMIFFLDASGGPNSGGLRLTKDNEGTEVLFDPPKLRNTSLVYNIMDDFYHGFPPIAKGKSRKVITALFSQVDYVA